MKTLGAAGCQIQLHPTAGEARRGDHGKSSGRMRSTFMEIGLCLDESTIVIGKPVF